MVVVDRAQVVAAVVLDIQASRVVGVRVVSNPEKLGRLTREFTQVCHRG